MAADCPSGLVDMRNCCWHSTENSGDAMVGLDVPVRGHVYRDLARSRRLRTDLGMVRKRNCNGCVDTDDIRFV